jgi:hypothetical protein
MAMLLGSCISMVSKYKNITILSNIFFAIFGLNAILPIFVPPQIAIYGMFPYLMFFIHYENVLKEKIIQQIEPNCRCYVMSLATTTTAIASIIITYFFHFLGATKNYLFGYCAVFFVFSIVILLAKSLIKSNKIIDNK